MAVMKIDVLPLTPDHLKPVVTSAAFGKVFSNRMFTQEYTSERGWHNAQIGLYRPIVLDPAAAVFHYGQEIFEGTKAYRRADGKVNLFRPWENAARFNRSASRMAMQQVDPENHVEAIAQLVRLESDWVPSTEGASLYIRPTMIATVPELGVVASSRYLHYIIVGPVGAYFANGFQPISVFVSDEYVRAVKGGTGAAKTGGNYASSLIVGEQVRKAGYQQVLWLDGVERRYVEEVGAMNIAFVRGKEIITPALSGSILEGITRDSVLKMAPDLGYSVREERLDINEVLAQIDQGKISESFGIGTAAVIAPVGRFGYKGNDHTVGNGQPGPVAMHLYKSLTDLQYGRREDPYGWTMTV
jgi:branched-chain amino acid aminotransferase